MEAADDTAPLKVQLPRAAAPLPAPAAAGKPEATGEAERNPIFDALVSPDEDIAGLVAYSIYKQNKRAWLDDFIKATGRSPTEAESRAYIIGESTERRLTTYRHLAAATLSAGLVIRVAISRARVAYCGARISRRSAISES